MGRYERLFSALRELRAFERQALPHLRTLQEHDLLCEIGYRQAIGKPLCVKEALLLSPGSPAKLQRRLRRLQQSHVIEVGRAAADRRMAELKLTRRALDAFAGYAPFLLKNAS